MGFGKVTSTVLLFGIGMIVLGMLMQIFKGSFVNRVKDIFWIDNIPFLDLMDVGYNVVPIIVMIVGIICVFISAAEAKSQKVVSP